MSEIVRVRCDWCGKTAEVIQHTPAQTRELPTWEYPSGWRVFFEGTGFQGIARIHACPKCDPVAKRERIREKEAKRAERELKKKEREGTRRRKKK